MTDTSSSLRILLTNDDGVNTPGIAAMREGLIAVGDVTVIAPAENQSGAGRVHNEHMARRDRPQGYALEGTPADCVVYALRGLGADSDIVVSSVNDGPNAGNYVAGQSGTVGAGVGAAFLGMPAVAVSSYHTRDFFCHPSKEYDFSRPARVACALTECVFGTGVFDEVDLLNINTPADVPNPRMRVTHPLADYDQQVSHDPDAGTLPDDDREHDLDDGEMYVRLQDISQPDSTGFEDPLSLDDEHRDRYPVGSDRRVMIDGKVSISPLVIHHGHATDPQLTSIAESLSKQVE